MTKRLEKDRLTSELASVNAMLSTVPEDDFVGRMGFTSRKEEIESELRELDHAPDTFANVALLFYGKPVQGSRSINTEFAAKALENYQDLVARQLASFETGGLAQRGPLPSKQAAALNITGVTHGSFGFVLEEDGSSSPQLINSSLKNAVEKVSGIFDSFASEKETVFDETIREMDPRLFSSVKSFFKVVHENEATMRIIDGKHDRKFDARSINRAHTRCQEGSIDEVTVTVTGTLIGIVPTDRRFEMRLCDGETITGKAGVSISKDYLERIENDRHFIGQVCEAELLKKTVDRPGQATRKYYTLLDLKQPQRS